MIGIVTALLLCAAGPAYTQPALLERGNNWVRGLPALEQNAFPAMFGEYRADGALFRVWICAQPLLFTGGGWQPLRAGGQPAPAGEALEKTDENGRYVALQLEPIGHAERYTVLFLFPRVKAPAGAVQTRLMRTWTDRFRYFLRAAHGIEDISLPAVVDY